MKVKKLLPFIFVGCLLLQNCKKDDSTPQDASNTEATQPNNEKNIIAIDTIHSYSQLIYNGTQSEVCNTKNYIGYVKNLEGTVEYDEQLGKYAFRASIPNTYDSFIKGILCDKDYSMWANVTVSLSAKAYSFQGYYKCPFYGIVVMTLSEIDIKKQ